MFQYADRSEGQRNHGRYRSLASSAFIARAQPFAKPILTRIRALVHRACPDATETIKWHMAAFQGRGLLVLMAAFKAHCALVFWKGKLVDPPGPLHDGADGHYGKITSLKDLPADALVIKKLRLAAELDAAGTPTPGRGARVPKKDPAMPADLRAALAKAPRAQKQFAAFSPSCKSEYVMWVTEAKRAETRTERIATAVGWIAQGKKRNWKYEAPRKKAQPG